MVVLAFLFCEPVLPYEIVAKFDATWSAVSTALGEEASIKDKVQDFDAVVRFMDSVSILCSPERVLRIPVYIYSEPLEFSLGDK